MLYSSVCPLATVIVFFYFCLQNKLMLYSSCYFIQRKLASSKMTASGWMKILEVLTIITVILSSFMLFLVSTPLKKFLERYTVPANEPWIIVGIEHLLLAILAFFKIVVKDIPTEIEKECLVRSLQADEPLESKEDTQPPSENKPSENHEVVPVKHESPPPSPSSSTYKPKSEP